MHETTVKFDVAAKTACAVGLTVMVLETEASALPHASVAVHVSVTVPPQAPGVAVNVDALEVPDIKQLPERPLVKLLVLLAGTPPQATVIFPGLEITGKAAGLTVIV